MQPAQIITSPRAAAESSSVQFRSSLNSVGLELFKGKPSGLTSNLTISLIGLVKGQYKVLIKDYDNSGPNKLPQGQKTRKRKLKSRNIRVHPFQIFVNLPRICSLLRINSVH